MRGEHYLENLNKKPETIIKELEELATKPTEDVRELEKRMVEIYCEYDTYRYEHHVVESIESLRFQRRQLMAKSFKWTDENVARLEAANEQMKEALLDMRRKTIEVYETLNHWRTPDKVLRVEGRLFVKDMVFEGWEDDEYMQDTLSKVMLLQPYSGFYTNSVDSRGYSLEGIGGLATCTPDKYVTENKMLYLSESPDNWNELMNRKKTNHLHIIYAVYNLYERCLWSLQDLLGIRSYGIGIEIEQVDC